MESEIEALRKENADLKRQLHSSLRIRYQLDIRIQDEASKRTKAYNALKFYADSTNYSRVTLPSGHDGILIHKDNGKVARSALYRK